MFLQQWRMSVVSPTIPMLYHSNALKGMLSKERDMEERIGNSDLQVPKHPPIIHLCTRLTTSLEQHNPPRVTLFDPTISHGSRSLSEPILPMAVAAQQHLRSYIPNINNTTAGISIQVQVLVLLSHRAQPHSS